MRASGLLWFLLVPMLAFFVFPFSLLPDNVLLSTLILLVCVVFAYYLAFLAFVRVANEKEIPENHSAR